MKKLLSVLLALLLLLALLPAAALAATPVSTVYAYTTAPVGGMTVPYGNDDPEAPRVTSEGVHMSLYEWWDSDGKMMYGEQFVTGKTYTLRVQVFADGGYAITDAARGYINGHHGAELNRAADYLTFSLEFTAEAPKEITAFSVSVAAPAVGEHASLDVAVSGAELEVKEVYWTYGTTAELDDTHVFEAGPSYTMWISVAPKDPGAYFKEHNNWPDVLITCGQAEVYNPQWDSYHPGWLHFGLDFGKLNTQTVPKVDFFNVTPPAEGVKPAFDVTLAGEHYSLTANEDNGFHTGVRWFDLTTGAPAAHTETGVLLPFQAGHQYRVDLEVVPSSGWSFDPAVTTATVNGQAAGIEGLKTKAVVSFTFPALEENQVVSGIDLTVPAPKIGEETSYAVQIAGAGLHRAAISDGYTQNGVKWYRNNVTMVPGAIFGSNFVYAVEVTVELDSGYEFAASGGKYTAAATVNGQSAEVEFSLNGKRAEVYFTFPKIDRILDHIEIITPPDKTEYKAGESFDPAGMEVLAVFKDHSNDFVGVTVTPKVLQVSDTYVTISYTEGSVTATEKVPVKVSPAKTPASLAVTKAPAKTEYKAGEQFDPKGMELTVTYTDQTSGLVKPMEISPKILTEDVSAVTVSYKENDVTVTAVVPITVKAKDKDDKDKKENPFTDVAESDYFYDAVIWAYYAEPQVTMGIGGGLFGPDSTVKRCEAVTFLWRAVGCPEPKSALNPFADVAESDYFYKPVLWAVEKGITVGTDDTHFSPNQTCSTAHIITFLYRALGIGENGWYEVAEAWAKGAGLLDGLKLAVAPGVDCPRRDVVLFLYRAVGK